MLWSTSTAWASPKLYRILTGMICAAAVSGACFAQAGLRAPGNAIAGEAASIATTGSGSGTFYLVGPGISNKREVKLGDEISLDARQLQNAGKYLAIVCSDSCKSADFFVSPAKPESLTFLVHPSRAPVDKSDVISGVAFPFDEFNNLVLAPLPVNFQLSANGASVMSRAILTQGGVAWFRTSSGRSAGALQVMASVDKVSTRRVVQEVASDPCNLRIKGSRAAKGIVVETEPVKDCTGNPVPDGTVVTFTATSGKEKSTVDAPIKQGIARAQMTASGVVVISAASGVVAGNELRLGANQAEAQQ